MLITRLSACALFAVGCAAKYEPGTGGDDDDTTGAADAAVVDTPDAAPVAPPDAAPPPPLEYPSGPYGTHTGDTIEKLSWQGFLDTDADGDSDPFNEAAHTVTLEDFFVGRDPDAKLLVITESAGWCPACQEEASNMPSMAAQWVPQGVRFMTAMLEDENGNPSGTSFAHQWGDDFNLTTPVVADPDHILDPYYVDNGIPFNLFIETAGMTIVHKMSGWDQNEAEGVFETYTR